MSEQNLDNQFINSYIELVEKIVNKLKNENIIHNGNSNGILSRLTEIKNDSTKSNVEKIADLINIINEVKEKNNEKNNTEKNNTINLELILELFNLSISTLNLLDFNKNNKKFINSISSSISQLTNSIESANVNPIIKNIRSLINGKYQTLKQNSVNKNIKIRELTIKLSTLYKLLKNKNINVSRIKEEKNSLETITQEQIQTLRNALLQCKAVPNQSTITTNLNRNSTVQGLLSTLQKTNITTKSLQKISNQDLTKYIGIVNGLIESMKSKLPFDNTEFTTGGSKKRKEDKGKERKYSVNQQKKIMKKKIVKKRKIKGGSKENEIQIIQKIYDILKNIVDLPFIVKLSALTPREIVNIFLQNENITFSNNQGIVYQNKDILHILSKFLYVNITPFMTNIFSSYSFNSDQETIVVKKSNQTILGTLRNSYFNQNDLNNLYHDTLHMINLLKNCSNSSNSSNSNHCKNIEIVTSVNKIVYMNIFRFMDILSNVSNTQVDAFYQNIFPTFAIHIINNNFLENDLLKNIEKIMTILESSVNIKNAIDKLYLTKSTENIITYLRIRCDPTNGNLDTYNKRFHIQINPNNTLLNIGYNNHDFPYYARDSTSQQVILHPSLRENINSFSNYYNTSRLSAFVNAFQPKKYEYNYRIGPFNNIFPPKNGEAIVNNKDISDRLSEIMVNLNQTEENRKPVFILGYGASGSGKTSSLIYFNKGSSDAERNGVLITLCNQFAKESGYYRISVKSFEFYSNPHLTTMPTSYNKSNILEKKVPSNDNETIDFGYYTQENGITQFLLINPYTHHNTFIDRTKTETTVFPKNTPMGEVLIHLIDNDRYVKATPNNPNSSRSHALIIVKFIKTKEDSHEPENTPETNPPTLIIGDFAGVENIFDCADQLTLSGFANARINGNSTKNKFYNVYSPSVGILPRNSGTSGCRTYTQDTYIPVISPHIRAFNHRDYDFNTIQQNVNTFFRPQNGEHNFTTFVQIDEIIKKLFNGTEGVELYKNIEESIINLVGSDIYSKSPEIIRTTFTNNIDRFKLMYKFLDFYNDYQTVKSREGSFSNEAFVKKIIGNILGSDGFLNELKRITGINEYFKLTIKRSNNTTYTQNRLLSFWAPIITEFINRTIDKIKVKYNIQNINNLIQNIIMKETNTTDFEFYKIMDKPPPVTFRSNSRVKYNLDVKTFQSSSAHTNPDGILDGILDRIIIRSDKTSTQVYTEITEIINNALLLSSFNGENNIEKIMNLFKWLDDKQVNILQFKKLLQYIYVMTMNYCVEVHCRNQKSLSICQIRRSEGYMINGTLGETREIIKNMIIEKNKGAIRIIPPFINECLPFYCIDKECFTQGSSSSIISNTIFHAIKNYIGNEEIFKKMVISIFMVFNASPLANNPPPIPYIDIYKYNRMLYKIKNNQSFDFNKFKEIINNVIELITYFKNKSIILRNDKVYKKFMLFKEELDKEIINKENIKSGYFQILESFKHLIDNNNAASSIGTLEFLDLMAKYYTTKIMCKQNISKRDETFKDLLETRLKTILSGGSKKKKILKRK